MQRAIREHFPGGRRQPAWQVVVVVVAVEHGRRWRQPAAEWHTCRRRGQPRRQPFVILVTVAVAYAYARDALLCLRRWWRRRRRDGGHWFVELEHNRLVARWPVEVDDERISERRQPGLRPARVSDRLLE